MMKRKSTITLKKTATILTAMRVVINQQARAIDLLGQLHDLEFDPKTSEWLPIAEKEEANGLR